MPTPKKKLNAEKADKPPEQGGVLSRREPVTLIKGGHQWTFACDAGQESELLRRLSELAASKDIPFDWFDAALVSHQLSKRLKPGLSRIDSHTSDAR